MDIGKKTLLINDAFSFSYIRKKFENYLNFNTELLVLEILSYTNKIAHKH